MTIRPARSPLSQTGLHRRVRVLHGVNFDVLERRSSQHYGQLSLSQLEHQIASFAAELGLETSFFQTNHEGEFVAALHEASNLADGLILNPGAWTHYSWAIHDALEIAEIPTVEVHLSDLSQREPFRQLSVISDLCVATVTGRGVDGYREGLEKLQFAIDTQQAPTVA